MPQKLSISSNTLCLVEGKLIDEHSDPAYLLGLVDDTQEQLSNTLLRTFEVDSGASYLILSCSQVLLVI